MCKRCDRDLEQSMRNEYDANRELSRTRRTVVRSTYRKPAPRVSAMDVVRWIGELITYVIIIAASAAILFMLDAMADDDSLWMLDDCREIDLVALVDGKLHPIYQCEYGRPE